MLHTKIESAQFTAPTEFERDSARIEVEHERAVARELARHKLALAIIDEVRERALRALEAKKRALRALEAKTRDAK